VISTLVGPTIDANAGRGTNIELRWVEESVAIAARRAEASGWDAVHWEDHLQWMLGVTQ
jgi:hypothetical protein